jgi:hypothetical protein
MSIDTIYKDIDKLIQDSRIWAEVGIDPSSNTIEVEITWGDWKHDHLYCDWLIKDYLNERSIRCIKSEIITEENGSDSYSSIHCYYIVGEVN